MRFLSSFRQVAGRLTGTVVLAGLLAGCGGAGSSSATADAPETIRLDYAYYNPLSLVLKQQGWQRDADLEWSRCMQGTAGCFISSFRQRPIPEPINGEEETLKTVHAL